MKTDNIKQKLIDDLYELSKKEKVNLWKVVAKELESSTKRMRTVNLYKISESCKKGETALVPGKVLSLGDLSQDITVSSFQISEKAKSKIKSYLPIRELIKKNPKGKNVRIMG